MPLFHRPYSVYAYTDQALDDPIFAQISGRAIREVAFGTGNPPPLARRSRRLFFYCDDLSGTYEELTARGVEFPQPAVDQPFGWWSIFHDGEGNRFALTTAERTGTVC